MQQPSLLISLTHRLRALSETPALDASVLLGSILEKPRAWVIAHPELQLSAGQQKELDNSLARLEAGHSFPYVLGRWPFFGLDLEVTPDVLIPRPETELLVEKALAWLRESPSRRAVADVGTGSGAIAISLAVSLADVQVTATDLSEPALEVARRNAARFGVDSQIEFIRCDLLPPFQEGTLSRGPFDLLCANLPYIPTRTLHGLTVFGREPTLALDGGADGLDLIGRLLAIGPSRMAAHGRMFLEIEATQGEQALGLARDLIPGAELSLHKDLAGRDRLLEIELPA